LLGRADDPQPFLPPAQFLRQVVAAPALAMPGILLGIGGLGPPQ
jgi:hypothetical protein